MSRNQASRLHPIVQQIIDRDCHVSLSPQEVVRHVISKLRNGYDTFRAMRKRERRRLIDDCISRHRANWQVYAGVMSGVSARRYGRKGDEGVLDRLSGAEVVALMRKHKVTIAGLAFRLGATESRVRDVRRHGTRMPTAVRSWLKAIRDGESFRLPEKYRIHDRSQEAECGFCGYPLFVKDDAFDFEGGIFCSTHCCRMSRNWR